MVKVTKREWDIMKRPVYPNIHFHGQGPILQAQTMANIGDGSYYYPIIFQAQMRDASGIISFGEEFLKELDRVGAMEIDENDKDLYKVEG